MIVAMSTTQAPSSLWPILFALGAVLCAVTANHASTPFTFAMGAFTSGALACSALHGAVAVRRYKQAARALPR
jgi:hypothetical protein